MKVVMPGGSGFLGESFRQYIVARGWEAVVLTRSPKAQHERQWDGKTLGPWAETLADADAIASSLCCPVLPQCCEQIRNGSQTGAQGRQATMEHFARALSA